jgi:C1A family cysteine protease
MPERTFGWVRDLPDFRDLSAQTDTVPAKLQSLDQPSVNAMLLKLGVVSPQGAPPKSSLPATTDLRQYCSPIEDQGNLGSCTAHAAMSLLEYFEKKSFGKHINGSRLFLYKTTRNLMQVTGDTGAYMRTTMGALTLFGVPPESYYPYDITKFDAEPGAFLYSFAQNFQSTSYYRLDAPGVTNSALLTQIKTNLSKGLPSMSGFTVYNSYSQTDTNGGCFPFPNRNDAILGGHAVAVMGYDDKKKITNSNTGGTTTTGALLIRNSWGTPWGQGGYGWLPYQYVTSGLTSDWWSLMSAKWVDSGQFA